MQNRNKSLGLEEKSSSKDCDTDKKFYGIPYPSIYLFPLRVACPLCKHQGHVKIRKNLWQLRMHFTAYHQAQNEAKQCKNIVSKISRIIKLQNQLIEMGVWK